MEYEGELCLSEDERAALWDAVQIVWATCRGRAPEEGLPVVNSGASGFGETDFYDLP